MQKKMNQTKLKFFIKYCLAVILSLSASSTIANDEVNYPLKTLVIKNGLPSSFINSLSQDKNGYIWIGTSAGLARYDGKDYKLYKHQPNDNSSISNNDVTDILEDSKQRLWIGTKNGLNRLNKNRNNIDRYRHSESNPSSISNDRILALFQDSKQRIWIATENGVNLYIEATNNFKKFNSSKNDENRTTFVIEDNNNRIWIGTINGLYIFNEKTQNLEQETTLSNNQININKYRLMDATLDQKGNIWLATDGDGLIKFNPETLKAQQWLEDSTDKKHSITCNRIWKILADKNGNIWLGHFFEGISIISNNDSTIKHLIHIENNLSSLPSNRVSDLIQDESGLIWISTHNGLVTHNPEILNIKKIDKHKISSSFIYSVLETKNSLWVGTDNGINKIDNLTGETTQYTDIGNSKGKNHITVWDIEQSSEQDIILLGSNWGLMEFNTTTSETKFLSDNENYYKQLSDSPIYAIQKLKDDSILLGTYSGTIGLYDKKNNSIKTNTELKNKEIYITEIISDSPNTAMITTEKGLYKLDTSTFKLTAIPISKNNVGSIINDIAIDNKGNVWVASSTDGIVKLSKNKNNKNQYKHEYFNQEDGLPDNIIKAITLDKNNILWIATQNKIASINTENNKISVYNSLFSDINIEFQENAALNNASEWVIFGGNNGAILFRPESMSIRNYNPNVAVSSIINLNKEVSFSNDKAIEFSYLDRLLTFKFSSLDYSNSSANKYSYKINDDGDWINLGTSSSLMLSNLRPGDYKLQVRGSNSDEVWSTDIAKIAFTITPAWWQSDLAYAIYATIIISTLLILYIHKQKTINALSYQANHDALTGLPNRQYLMRKLNTTLSEYEQSQQAFSLVFFDLNKFKTINDTHGHDCGDAVLIELSRRVKLATRRHDFLARLAGDEFILLLLETDKKGLDITFNRIMRNFEIDFTYNSLNMKFSASFGVAIYRGENLQANDLIAMADEAMYEAKKAGSNRYVIYEEKTHT